MTEAAFGSEWSAAFRRGSDSELRGWVEAALEWCDATDSIALRHFRRDLEITRKPDTTFVTQADTAVERLLRDRIAEAYPDHGVLGEEFGADAAGADPAGAATRWIIDPIDGTHNYLRGVPLFSTLIAIEREGELQGCVMSAPALGMRWYAWRGGGAWVRGGSWGPEPQRIRVSGISAIEEAQVLYASTRELDSFGRAPGWRTLLDRAWRERGFGDFWGYTLVAESAAEIMVESDLSPWDAAAPLVLIEEAGGRATDFEGNRSVYNRTFLATNGRLHDQVLGILSTRTEDAAR
jgi:histidinol-phosphatase